MICFYFKYLKLICHRLIQRNRVGKFLLLTVFFIICEYWNIFLFIAVVKGDSIQDLTHPLVCHFEVLICLVFWKSFQMEVCFILNKQNITVEDLQCLEYEHHLQENKKTRMNLNRNQRIKKWTKKPALVILIWLSFSGISERKTVCTGRNIP